MIAIVLTESRHVHEQPADLLVMQLCCLNGREHMFLCVHKTSYPGLHQYDHTAAKRHQRHMTNLLVMALIQRHAQQQVQS